MRKVFIDGGANAGQSAEAFLKHWPDSEQYEIFMFEPDNTSCESIRRSKLFHSRKVSLIQKAIWIKDGKIPFFSAHPGSEGNTVIKEKVLTAQSYKEYPVDCVQFSNWIKKNVNKSDYLIVKLDIEGAEYDVVKDLKEKKVMPLIDMLFLEIHGLKAGKKLKETVELLNTIKSENLKPYMWNAETFDYGTYKDKYYDYYDILQDHERWTNIRGDAHSEEAYRIRNKIF